MRPTKTTLAGAGYLAASSLFGQPLANIPLRGYEIHVGETSYLSHTQPFANIVRQISGQTESVADGCISEDSRIFGTYLHGLFDEDAFRHAFIGAARAYCHLSTAGELNDWGAKRQESLNRLASVVSQSLDMRRIFDWVKLSYEPDPLSEARDLAL